MRNRLVLVLAALGTTTALACAAPIRSVTHISSWSGEAGDYFYLAYTENDLVSRIKLCRIHEDNAVSCVDQPEVDRLLNPQ